MMENFSNKKFLVMLLRVGVFPEEKKCKETVLSYTSQLITVNPVANTLLKQ